MEPTCQCLYMALVVQLRRHINEGLSISEAERVVDMFYQDYGHIEDEENPQCGTPPHIQAQ